MSANLEDGGVEYEDEVFEEEEVEVTDDEDDEPPTPVKEKTPSKSPGKVNPTDAVKNMKHSSPSSARPSPRYKFSPSSNPFDSFGQWDEKSIGEINIAFPHLATKNESTNDLTRTNAPENRYWKAPITFSYSTFKSETLRFDNVQIPFMPSKGYGKSFVYMCLPWSIAPAFGDAGKTIRPTIVHEAKLNNDEVRWWKPLNKIDEKFGIIVDNKFVVKPPQTIMASTGKGMIVNVVVRFVCKAHTEDKSPLLSTTVCTIGVELERAFIAEIGVDCQPPTRVQAGSGPKGPVATRRDVATDDLSRKLTEMGL